jgi:isoleucyl-tRNA synthetase
MYFYRRKEGADVLDQLAVDLLPRNYVRMRQKELMKEMDIRRWFDSGVSHAAVLNKRKNFRGPRTVSRGRPAPGLVPIFPSYFRRDHG